MFVLFSVSSLEWQELQMTPLSWKKSHHVLQIVGDSWNKVCGRYDTEKQFRTFWSLLQKQGLSNSQKSENCQPWHFSSGRIVTEGYEVFFWKNATPKHIWSSTPKGQFFWSTDNLDLDIKGPLFDVLFRNRLKMSNKFLVGSSGKKYVFWRTKFARQNFAFQCRYSPFWPKCEKSGQAFWLANLASWILGTISGAKCYRISTN